MRRSATWALVILVGGAIFLLCYRCVETKYWQRWRFDRRWCRAAAVQAKPIIEALAAYRLDCGRYPDELSALTPEHLTSLPQPVAHPTGNGGAFWCYHL